MQTLKVGDKKPLEQIHAAQWLLSGHNVFKHQEYYGGPKDEFTSSMGHASQLMKYWLGYKKADCLPLFGQQIYDILVGHQKLTPLQISRRISRKFQKPPAPPQPVQKFIYPLKETHGQEIGFPGIGTHSWLYPPNNWESDNAVDIGCPYGTTILAVADGVIGRSFGPLSIQGSRFKGIRLHLETADDEFYYAHLSSTFPGLGPGKHVRQGDILGKSGDANGVYHLHLGERYGNPERNFFK